jgi:hypothetical protein
MGLKEFQDLLDRYGGDPEAWPDDRREEALALAGISLDARRLFEKVRDMERLLAAPGLPEPEPSADAIDRVMARIAITRPGWPRRRPAPTIWARLRALAEEVNGVLGGLVLSTDHPAATVSLIGILIGVADRAVPSRTCRAAFSI